MAISERTASRARVVRRFDIIQEFIFRSPLVVSILMWHGNTRDKIILPV